MALKLIIIAAILLGDLVAALFLGLRGLNHPNPPVMFLAAGATLFSGIAAAAIIWMVL